MHSIDTGYCYRCVEVAWSVCLFVCVGHDRVMLVLLYPPSEQSERGIYCDALISFRPSVNTLYLDANISKTV